MRPLLVAALLSPVAATAQVTLDPGALDALRPSTARPAPDPAMGRPTATRRSKAVARPIGPSAPVQIGLPSPPDLAPPVAVPVRPAEPLPPIPVASGATGGSERLPDGIRVSFAPGQSGLAEADVAALRTWIASVPDASRVGLTVAATASGSADDPSAARRLSLARALAVRAVALAAGIPSPRIAVYALGQDPSRPPDRCDATLQHEGHAR